MPPVKVEDQRDDGLRFFFTFHTRKVARFAFKVWEEHPDFAMQDNIRFGFQDLLVAKGYRADKVSEQAKDMVVEIVMEWMVRHFVEIVYGEQTDDGEEITYSLAVEEDE
jgi:hypothetical protein